MNHIPHPPRAPSLGETVNIKRRALAEVIARCDAGGEGWRIPIFRAARDGLINFSIAMGGSPFPAHLFHLERPTLAILADDIPEATGPDRWPQARRLLRWANAAILHASGGQEMHSIVAVETALAVRRVLLVEMQQREHPAWLALAMREVPRLRVLNIRPPAGGQHPIQGAPPGVVVQ